MMLLDARWTNYLNVQLKLDSTYSVNDSSWGLEVELNRAINGDGRETLECAARSGSRRERYRRALLRRQLRNETDDPEVSAQARQQLKRVQEELAAAEWELASSVAIGITYDEIADKTGVSAGALRVRMQRTRDKLAARLQRPIRHPPT